MAVAEVEKKQENLPKEDELSQNKKDASIPKQGKDDIRKKGKKKKGKIIIILIAVVCLTGIAFVLGKMNILGLGDKFSKVPVVGKIFTQSKAKDSLLGLELSGIDKLSAAKAKSELKKQLSSNQKLSDQINQLKAKNGELNLSINGYKMQLNDYNALKNQLKQQQDKVKQLQGSLAKQSINLKSNLKQKLNKNLANMAAYYVKMDADTAGPILEKLYKSNKTLAVQIMSQIGTANLSDIFASMDADTVQKITQDLYALGIKNINNSN